jgi:excisionase family DNA binding protein
MSNADATLAQRETIRINEAQRLFSLSRTTLYRLRASGQVRFYRVGSAVLVDLASLRAAIMGAECYPGGARAP